MMLNWADLGALGIPLQFHRHLRLFLHNPNLLQFGFSSKSLSKKIETKIDKDLFLPLFAPNLWVFCIRISIIYICPFPGIMFDFHAQKISVCHSLWMDCSWPIDLEFFPCIQDWISRDYFSISMLHCFDVAVRLLALFVGWIFRAQLILKNM